MSNIAISASAIALPKFDRAQIMRSAWEAYRLARPAICAAGDTAEHRVFLPDFFAKMLRKAWADAKKVATTAQAFIAAQARVTASKLAALSPGERSVRISQIRDELTTLDYAPFGVRTANRRRDLAAELSALAA